MDKPFHMEKTPTTAAATATQKRAALTVATLSSFLGPLLAAAVNVALPSIGTEFSLGAVGLGWINTAFLLAAAAMAIPFGRLGDIYGRKRIFTGGVVTLLVSSALIALCHSGTVMILLRILQGLGSSMIFATAIPIISSVFPPQERGRALGISVAAVYLGLSLGPLIGGFLTQQLGWRSIFWLGVPFGGILLSVTLIALKGDWADAGGTRFDKTGAALLAVSLPVAMYGFSTLPNAIGIILLLLSLIGITAFVRFEGRTTDPLIDIKLFRENTIFAFSVLAALINYAATFAVSFLMSLYLQKVRNFSPQLAGLVMLAQPALMTLISPVAGRLSDRIEPRTLASLGMGATLAGLVMLTVLTLSTPVIYIILTQAVLGIGFGLFSSPNTNAIMGSVTRKYYGVAGSMVSTVRQVGMMFSMGIVMMVLAVMMGRGEITTANQDSFLNGLRLAFIIFAALSLLGIFASLSRGRRTVDQETILNR